MRCDHCGKIIWFWQKKVGRRRRIHLARLAAVDPQDYGGSISEALDRVVKPGAIVEALFAPNPTSAYLKRRAAERGNK